MKKLNFGIVVPRFVNKVGDSYIFPLGIAYIAASLKESGFNVVPLNLNHNEGDIKKLVSDFVLRNKIDVLCTGGMSMHFSNLFKIIKASKEANPKVTTVVGGGIITAEPEVAMPALEYADIGVVGEGEKTIAELAECIYVKDNIAKVPGLIYKEGNGYCKTAQRGEIKDVDSIPRPDLETIEIDKYLKLPSHFTDEKFFTVLGSRSCPFKCTFCFHTVGNKYRMRSLSSLKSEISELINKYNIRFFYIADELFGQNKNRIREFCDFARETGFYWRTNFRVSDIDEEVINCLKRGNCSVVSLGIESANDNILKSMRKHITVAQIERALKLLYSAGLTIEGNFIFGDKEETYDTAMQTLDWWEAHKEYNLNLLWIQVFPGTYLYKYACEKGIINNRVKYLKDDCPSVNVSKMSDEELGKVALRMIQAPFGEDKDASDVKLERINSESMRVDVSGTCVVCRERNYWSNIKLFTFGDIGLACKSCGKKHTIYLPEEAEDIFVQRLNNLLRNSSKVGIWGVTYNTVRLFNKYKDIFSNEKLILIDATYAKQKIRLDGKEVYPHSIIEELKIPVLISFYSNYTESISNLCSELYPSCRKVYDAGELICSTSISV